MIFLPVVWHHNAFMCDVSFMLPLKDEAFEALLKDYEPYDLLDIKNSILEVKKKTAQYEVGNKLETFYKTLRKIDTVFYNSMCLKDRFEHDGQCLIIDYYEDYYFDFDRANIARNQFLLEIANLEASKQTEYNDKNEDTVSKPETLVLLETGNLTSKVEIDNEPLLSPNEAAKFLSISKRKLDGMSDEDIPRHRFGRSVRYMKSTLIG